MDPHTVPPSLRRHIIVHGHFYQPPREDPWLKEIPRDAAAAPFHDLHELVERDCYRAVAAARVLDTDAKIARVINLFGTMSFDVGPTLLDWLERAAPETYAAILDADRRSAVRLGHGNALAHPFHHVILPLCSRRDKETEVRWGVADFRQRFGRAPEGMWLPETAVDDETLDVLAQEGIRFTVVAPHQLDGLAADGRAARVVTSSGREIALFSYDGPRSDALAFGSLLSNARIWKSEMLATLDTQRAEAVVALVAAGETFGHHHKFGEMALAWLLQELSAAPGVTVSNFATVLAAMPPFTAGSLAALTSSWSCAHGVERWRADCGCRVDRGRPPQQAWRGTMRDALAVLKTALDRQFETEGAAYFAEPWAARDAYGAVLREPMPRREAAIAALCRPALSAAEWVRAAELLEMQRDALRMFSSCAWFGDDLGGADTVQTLRYAARALDLAGPDAGNESLEQALRAALREARSADGAVGSGEDVWVRQVRPVVPPMARLAAGAAAAQAFVPHWSAPSTAAFAIAVTGGQVELTNWRTGRRRVFDVAVQRRGVADVQTYVRARPDLEADASGTATLAGTIPISLDQCTEREQIAVLDGVRRIRRRDLARRLFGEARLAELADGDTTLVDIAVAGLAEAVGLLGTAPRADATARALDLMDLLELCGHHAPFDVQSIFAQQLGSVPVADRAALAVLAMRLGFGEEFLVAGVD